MDETQHSEWEYLPEPVLLKVFRLLTLRDVIACNFTCLTWHSISEDNLLWKYFVKRDFKLKKDELKLSEDCSTWKEEYARLVDTPPSVLTQTLKAHTDEVLHVAFSNDGSQIASCSKDRRVIIWNQNSCRKFEQHFVQDMDTFHWLHTWAAQYSPNDSMLMLAGVVNQVGGELAIFRTGKGGDGKFVYLCRVVNDPYDVLGCWASNNLFLSGTMSADFFTDLEASIWLCQPPEVPDIPPQNAMIDQNGDTVELEPQQPHLNLNCYKGLLFKFRNMEGTVYLRYVQCFSQKDCSSEDSLFWSQSTDEVLREDDSPSPIEQIIEDETCINTIKNDKLCAVFLCGDKTTIPHQVGFQRLNVQRLNSPPTLQKPEKLIEFNGHVIGMAIASDQSKLFVNVRPWPENAVPMQNQPPAISTNINLHVVDLKTLKVSDEVYTGHVGYTPSESAFYLYLDISEHFVASGSENCKGYIWDRHFGGVVTTLEHEACVNCVHINPVDEGMCITASDDGTMKVWQSKKWKRDQQNR